MYKWSNHRGEEPVQLLLGALGPSQLAHWLYGGLAIAPEHRERALVPDHVYELRAAICGRSPLLRSAGWLWWSIYKSCEPANSLICSSGLSQRCDGRAGRLHVRNLVHRFRRCLCSAPRCTKPDLVNVEVEAVRELIRYMVADQQRVDPFLGDHRAHVEPRWTDSFVLAHARARLRGRTLLRFLGEFGQAVSNRRVVLRRLRRFHFNKQSADDAGVPLRHCPGCAGLLLPQGSLGLVQTVVLRVESALVASGPLLRDWQAAFGAAYFAHGALPFAYGASGGPV